MKFRALYPYIRLSFAYAIRPKPHKTQSPSYIGEVKSWIVKENTSPYKDNPDYFTDKGTYEDWLNKQKAKGKENTSYTKSIVSVHKRHPWATLSQARYKPRPGEKKISEAKKLVFNEEDLEWTLRSLCDKTLVQRAKGNQKRLNNWLEGVNLEEVAGLSRQPIDNLDINDELNKTKKLMFFNERGEDGYESMIDGMKRQGKIYGEKEVKQWYDNLTPDKKARLEKKFGKE